MLRSVSKLRLSEGAQLVVFRYYVKVIRRFIYFKLFIWLCSNESFSFFLLLHFDVVVVVSPKG